MVVTHNSNGNSSDLADVMRDISKLTDVELKDMCNTTSEDKYDELISQADKIKNLKAELDMLVASVRSLAEFNLMQQSDYENDRSRLLVLVADSNRLKADIQAKATLLMQLADRTSLDSTKSILMKAAEQAEKDSDIVSHEFLNNRLDYDPFIGRFSQQRKLTHLRRIKSDRLRLETSDS